VDAVANMNYFTQQNIDILQYKKHYSKTKNFTFTFYEESDVPFTFQSGQYIYLDIVLFEFHDAGAVLAKSLKIQQASEQLALQQIHGHKKSEALTNIKQKMPQ
jgi:hypothetical protein